MPQIVGRRVCDSRRTDRRKSAGESRPVPRITTTASLPGLPDWPHGGCRTSTEFFAGVLLAQSRPSAVVCRPAGYLIMREPPTHTTRVHQGSPRPKRPVRAEPENQTDGHSFLPLCTSLPTLCGLIIGSAFILPRVVAGALAPVIRLRQWIRVIQTP